ncbi:hypothetical protein FGIG_04051 [Fasciola gigantica]|uniref:Uncharacterized protein n=1 Tax=Fasciola gigantica TaxID=46835 RepID=A0A504YHJ6_FASGI|nr:hypothetical protein FGIG_04051 [Fasciola gigantica]
MGNCCERLCPNRSSSDEEAHERQRLLSSPSLSYDAVQPHLTSENVANRPLGPPALPLILPRAFGNPAALIDAPTMGHAEIEMARRIAQINGELYEDMRKQGQEDLIVQFNQTQPPI